MGDQRGLLLKLPFAFSAAFVKEGSFLPFAVFYANSHSASLSLPFSLKTSINRPRRSATDRPRVDDQLNIVGEIAVVYPSDSARQPMSRRQKPSGQSIRSTMA